MKIKDSLKKIYTIVVLLFNVIVRRRHYRLRFVAECEGTPDKPRLVKLWYYDFKHWGFDHHNLLMVSGADDLCEMYAKGEDKVMIDIVASRKDLGYGCLYDHYVAVEQPHDFNWLDKIVYGRNYEEDIKAWKKSGSHTKPRKFWICPVTLFVLGRYPKHIYIKRT